MAKRRKYEFKPDRNGTSYLKLLHLTKRQWLSLLKWSLYSALCLLLLVIQDVIMSHYRFSGATTDLAVCGILLIATLAGAEDGGLFALAASSVYWFSGSAPGPYVIAVITFLVVGLGLLRQAYWHRSFLSVMLCGAASMMAYEMILFLIGIFLGRTMWSRFIVFVLTGAMSLGAMLLLYPLVKLIGKIGGNSWNE